MSNSIAGILLAAGQSTRFGGNKLLQPLPDSDIPIAVQSARHLLAALPTSIAVVHKDDHVLGTLLAHTGIEVIPNPNPKLGMSSSIRVGIDYYSKILSIKGWVIALADMPFIPDRIIQQVADAVSNGALLAAPQYGDQRGHPVGFSRQLEDELLALEGDRGARQILEQYRNQLQLVKVNNNSILRDIDEPSDLAR